MRLPVLSRHLKIAKSVLLKVAGCKGGDEASHKGSKGKMSKALLAMPEQSYSTWMENHVGHWSLGMM